MTRSQLDRLGSRLRAGEPTDVDLRLLDEYRRSFAGAYDEVMGVLRDAFALNPTGRAAKSTPAIIGKLRRESARLSQIQDIAGCRVVVADVPAQNATGRDLTNAFESVSVVDRRERSSHGYRAVHLLVGAQSKTVEIQVRTALQQLWAESSEKLSDLFGIEVKYGGGPDDIRTLLGSLSDVFATGERLNSRFAVLRQTIGQLSVASDVRTQLLLQVEETVSDVETPRVRLMRTLEEFIRNIPSRRSDI